MTRSPKVTRKIVLSLVIVLGAYVSVQSQDNSSTAVLSDARILSQTCLPMPGDVGDGWRRPWEVPVRPISGLLEELGVVETEEDYWQAAVRRMGPWSSMRELGSSLDLSALAAELERVQNRNLSPARRLAAEWEAILKKLQRTPATVAELADNVTLREHDRVLMDSMARAGVTSDSTLHESEVRVRLIQEIGFANRRTEMSYLYTSDWNALGLLKDSDSLSSITFPFAVATVRLTLVDTSMLGKVRDLSSSEATALEKRLRELMQEALRTSCQAQAADLSWLEQATVKTADEAEQMRIRERINDLRSNLDQLRGITNLGTIAITPLKRGNHAYLMIARGLPPALSSGFPELQTAWVQYGASFVEVNLTGNLSSEALSSVMVRVLDRMEALIGSKKIPDKVEPKLNTTGTTTTSKGNVSRADKKKAEQFRAKGGELMKDKKYTEAEQEFCKAVQLDPTSEDSWLNFGDACAEQNKWAEAAQAYRQDVKLVPEEPFYHAKLAFALLKQDMRDAAVKEAKEALRLGMPKGAHPVFKTLGMAD